MLPGCSGADVACLMDMLLHILVVVQLSVLAEEERFFFFKRPVLWSSR